MMVLQLLFLVPMYCLVIYLNFDMIYPFLTHLLGSFYSFRIIL